MSLPVAFWDSSALIPLCAGQPQTPRARELFINHGIAVWWSSPVEIISGLTRLVRGGELSRDEYRTAKSLAETIATTWQMIGPSAPIAAKACLLLETYPLRAADALQLAAALEWCEGRPNGRVFLTFDRRLSEAASAVGFTLR